MSILDSFLLSISNQRVVVSYISTIFHLQKHTHEQDRSFQSLFTCFTNIFQYIRVIYSVLNSDLYYQPCLPVIIVIERLTVLDLWMVGPSPIGSLNGIPNSIISAPPASNANMRGTVESRVGKPAVMNVTNALSVSHLSSNPLDIEAYASSYYYQLLLYF
jgi:hypothetical protein